MDFNFLAAANGITSKYLNQLQPSNTADALGLSDELKGRFGEKFDQAYDEMQAARLLNASMRQSYEAAHKDDLYSHASRLGYSIDNRVIDMLHIEISDKMNAQIDEAMKNAIQSI